MIRNAVLLMVVFVGLPVGSSLVVDLVTFAVRAPDLAFHDAAAIAALAALILGVSIWGLRRSLHDHFTFRPTAKILATTACFATLMLWQVALLLDAGYVMSWGGWVYMSDGAVEIGYTPSPRYTGLRLFEFRDFPPLWSWDRMQWWPRTWNNQITGSLEAIRIPLWLLYAISVAAAACVFAKLRAPSYHFCHSCSYNLTGNESGICPECGEPVRTV
jgi:hypothetical protein